MPVDAKALTKKIGPLPAWGWGVAIGGAFLVVKVVRGSAAPSNPGAIVPSGSGGTAGDATTATGDPFSGANSLIEQLQSNLTDQQKTIAGLSTHLATFDDYKNLQTKLSSLLNDRSSLLSTNEQIVAQLDATKVKLLTCKTQQCKDSTNYEIRTLTDRHDATLAQLTGVNTAIKDTQTSIAKLGS